MRRILFLALCCLLFLPLSLPAQAGPVAGSTFTVLYNPPADSPLADAAEVTLIYVFDFWNVRYGTRLALWQNVLSPDTSRVRYARMERAGESWAADIPIPSDAALLSYIVTDGTHVDGNEQKTWVRYVMNGDGKPVMNARFYNIPFLKLARAEIGVLIREAEREVVDWPENFRAYQQYFTLLLEQAKGSPRTQERIAGRIAELEEQYGTDPGFLNMAAEVWYYVLQDQARALEYRKRIEPSAMWPQVFAMVDRQGTQQDEVDRVSQNQQRRRALIGNVLPEFNLRDAAGAKVAFPRRNGTPLVLLFWASTSERSCNMLDALRAAVAPLPEDALDIVAVSVDLEEKKALEHFSGQAMPFELLFNQGSTLHLLGVDSIPVTILVDGEDTVRDILVGYDTDIASGLRTALTALLRSR
ncbi:MAG: redoxin domain-containing protein [Bacteroidota bacterium]|nr:redoxin domain-containing protein [Bacteroidota bacterium]